MIFINRLFLLLFSFAMFIHAANVNVTTYYGKTGGIVGVLNTTSQVVNGRTICPSNPTVGCDFGDDPLFNNNGTTDDPSDDSYSGDLVVRTNDSFQAIAGWMWNGEAGGAKEKVTIKGTLPSTGILPDGSTGTTESYKWDTLPGSCDASESSISADKQTMICVRKDFDKNDVGTYSEDLPFNVIVKGETLSKTKPGDITFEISAEDAPTVSDDTDGYSLEVTAAPRWNLQKSMYTAVTGYEHNGVKGWLMDYKFYIEVDEVSGEVDNASALVGNESMGKDATFTFKDDMSELSPNATLVGCSFKGRFTNQDGYVGSADPLTYSGTGSLYATTVTYDARRITQTADERTINCTQSGSTIDIEAQHIDATLTNYPKLDYVGNALPVNRGIAAIGSIYIFVPLDDVKPQSQGGNNPEEDGWLKTTNSLTNFDPVTPTGNANFGGERESELDNSYSYTLYYSRGSFDKYYRGDATGVWNYPGGAIGYRSGDGMATQGYEFSTTLITNNTGGTPFTQEKICDVVDAYRLEIQDIEDNERYNIIKTYYSDAYHINSRPIMYRIWNGSADYVNGKSEAEEPYVFEYASSYEDDSWLPSQGGDQTISHKAEIEAECNAADTKWFATADEARADANGVGAVTKVRIKLRDGVEHNPGAYVYFWLNHKVRSHDLKTGLILEHGDEITNFSAYSFNGNAFTGANYKTMNFPEPSEDTLGDRITFTGPKARIIKDVDKVALTAGDEATFNLKLSFTNDTGIEEYGNVKVTDLLPKGLKYVTKSVTAPYAEPVIGTCADVEDINSSDTPCNNAENQVLIWDLGERRAGEIFPDINYSTIVGVEVNAGTIRNIVKIEAPTDASAISQRRSEVGMSVTIPASINIVKSTVENADYPSLRERTTVAKDINFVMDMRNGKAGDITDLDVIDILPFVGDADEGAILFNDLKLKRKVATSFHGTSIFSSMELVAHPLSSTVCDLSANGGVKYYYTSADPKTINIAPTVGSANDLTSADSIWCEGEGCIAKDAVTAVRARGPRMEAQAICQLKVSLSVKDNLSGDNYSNSTGASATGITLPVLSNSLAVPIVGSSLGDYVWYDKNANGIQDDDEHGIAGVTVKLLDGSGTAVKNPAYPTEDYVVITDANGKYSFGRLNSGDYIVEFVTPNGYLVTQKGAGTSSNDSNLIVTSSRTDVVHLEVDSQDLDIDAGFTTPIISGNIFVDGNNDGTVGAVKPFSAYDGTQLYVTLLDENGTILASKAVNSDGTYDFDGDDKVQANSNYSVVLSGASDATTSDLPSNWNSADGEHIGTGAGLDNAVDGKIAVPVLEANVPQVNFGINKKPVAQDVSKAIQFNPASNNQVAVGDLNISDLEDGIPTTVTLNPATNGKLYYDGVEIIANKVIENFDNSKLKVDPDVGAVTVTFEYTTTDKAGVPSDSATVTLPFKDLKIAGNLFIDGNGDGNVNGSKTSVADGVQLYVTLDSGRGGVVASAPLVNGSYLFDIEDGVRDNATYTVILSDANGSSVAKLPTDWDNNDGEKSQNSKANGNDGSADGKLIVNVLTSDVLNNDFAINKKPDAEDIEEPLQVNPGSSATVNVPDLNMSDNETDENLTVNITTLPSNARVYYDGELVVANQVIPNFNNLLLTIDPDAGEQEVTFNYTVTDQANVTSDVATIKMSFANIVISGTLFNDGNGDGNVNGTATNNADGKALYASLVDANGTLIASKPLNADGTYRFESVDDLMPNRSYMVVLTDIANTKTAKLPLNWTNKDGENIGLSGLDGDADGIAWVNLAEENIVNINFGINKKPEAGDKTEASQSNPGSTNQVVVPTLELADKEDGTPTTVVITKLPTNGTLYYDGVAVVLNENITNVDTTKFTFDPNDGDLTAEFTYVSVDKAGVPSDEAKVTMPFTDLKILGNVFNDGNSDGTINGTAISQPNNEQLYVTLVNQEGTAVASKSVNSDGSYEFGNSDGVFANSNYTLVLTTSENATEASLPTDWTNLEGEHIGSDAGTDGTSDGKIAVPVVISNIVEVNFGINKKPVAGDITEPLQLNPGTNVKVDVPTLTVVDNEDTTPSTIKITTLPTNGTVYYDGVAVTANQTIENFDNTKLTLDPENGDQTVSFKYVSIDEAGDSSAEATVMMSFDGLEINGNIFDDGDNNGTVDGTKIAEINGTKLYVTLLEANGTVMATMPIEADGSYGFDGTDGIVPNSAYKVILSREANATISELPMDWNHADGEHIGTDAGLDDNADGQIEVSVEEVDVNEVNLAVNARPTAKDKREIIQINPSGTTQVAVPALEIEDREDGVPSTVRITKLPTNGTLYYNGTAVEANQTIQNVQSDKFTIDPDNGDLVTTFNYVSIDVTGYESKEAVVAMPFDGLIISGEVFVDGNGDFVINGDKLTSRYGLNLFATLIGANGTTVVASVPVDGYGNYLFNDEIGIVPNSDYIIVLSDTRASVEKKLPSDWEYTHPAKIRVAVGVSDKVKQNFGVNGQPVTSDISVTQVNPNGTKQVAIPALDIATNEDATTKPTTVTIETLPKQGVLYYDGKELKEGEVIENFNNALLTLDPKDGEVSVSFTYAVADDAGFKSEPATVTMNFTDTDSDGDGIFDAEDLDDDNDGILDTVEEATAQNSGDTDGDGIPDRLDLDSDGDGILDAEEGDVDTDNDGKPDFQDVDSDNDGLSDLVEGGTDASLDENTDGMLDNQTDSDGDGIADVVDADNGGTPATTPDTDNDGIDNYRDLDSDGDALLDVIEIGGTDSDADGEIDTVGTLISGINLPDEDSNGIPDVLDAKLHDDTKVAPVGEVVSLDLIKNDTGNVDSSSIKLIIPKDFNGTARVSEDAKRMIVDGEGEWYVDENGLLTFTPEDGFTANPTPIQYRAKNTNGADAGIANVTITVSDVAGASTEVCDPYEESTVSLNATWSLMLMALLGTLFGLFYFRKEKN